MLNYNKPLDNTSSYHDIRDIFQLPKSENIYGIYQCTLWDKLFYPGHIYCTDNYICFFGKLFHKEIKTVLNVIDIKDSYKTDRFGRLSNSIKITMNSGLKYHFTGFKERESLHDLINALTRGALIICNSHKNSINYQVSESDIATAVTDDDTLDLSPSDFNRGKIVMLETNKDKDPLETLKVELPISVDEFYNNFFSDDAVFAYSQAVEINGGFNVEVTRWKNNQNDDNKYEREMNYLSIQERASFKKYGRVCSVHYLTKGSNQLEVKIVNEERDESCEDFYYVEELWKIKSEENNCHRCTLTITAKVIFLKKTPKEKMIKSRAYDLIKDQHMLWFEEAQEIIVHDSFAESVSLFDSLKDLKNDSRDEIKLQEDLDNDVTIDKSNQNNDTIEKENKQEERTQTSYPIEKLFAILISVIAFIYFIGVFCSKKIGQALHTEDDWV